MKKIVLRNGRTMRCPTFLLCIAGVLLAVGVLAAYTQSKDIDVYTERIRLSVRILTICQRRAALGQQEKI